MTETEWLTCSDPVVMLAFLPSNASVRKARLLAAACCRSMSRYLDPANQPVREDLLDLMERRAEIPLSWAAACDEDADVAQDYEHIAGCAEIEACYFMIPNVGLARGCLKMAAVLYAEKNGASGEEVKQAVFLRDIFGNPFRPVVADPAWLTEAAVDIARGIYDDRAFERLPILADALEEAGCDRAELLAHCREPGTHVRGCWAVDLVLGKS